MIRLLLFLSCTAVLASEVSAVPAKPSIISDKPTTGYEDTKNYVLTCDSPDKGQGVVTIKEYKWSRGNPFQDMSQTGETLSITATGTATDYVCYVVSDIDETSEASDPETVQATSTGPPPPGGQSPTTLDEPQITSSHTGTAYTLTCTSGDGDSKIDHYKWTKDGTDMAGEASKTLIVTATSTSAVYTCSTLSGSDQSVPSPAETVVDSDDNSAMAAAASTLTVFAGLVATRFL